MKKFILSVFIVWLLGCKETKHAVLGETKFQQELNAYYKDASTSPLKEKDLKQFSGLTFFPFDTTYLVQAKFIRLENQKPFKMKTTTARLPDYVVYGEVHFSLKGNKFKLNVYEGLNTAKSETLFLPFLDDTNGKETYVGGRYIDLKIPKNNLVKINFNEAYNPYCAYNEKYSCPIVPAENYLNTRVEAGVQAFTKH